MENNARKSQELDVRMETQGSRKMISSHTGAISSSSIYIPSAYGSSGGNYKPFSGPTSSIASSIRPPPYDTYPDHLGGTTQGFIGESVALLNNLSSQQTPNAWQPPSNKDQNLGLLSSSYVKKELSEFFTEQQHRQNISKMHGLHSGGANQGTIKDELSRGVPASRSMAPTTSTGFNTGAGRKYGRNNSLLTQTKMARSISVKDVIAVRTTDVKIVAHSSLHYLFVSKPKAA
ncbi:hypothetical protein HN51_059464 [Arachis hypogaea]